MADGRLNLHERYRIHALHAAGLSLRSIARELDRAPSTISRELRRNRTGRAYQPERAHALSRARRSDASSRPRIDARRIGRIEAYLEGDWSPQQIAGATGLASHEWIYRHVYADQRRGGSLFRCLRRKRRQRRRRGWRDGRGQLRNRRNLRERPAVVERRSRIGDWEVDTMYGRGKAVVVTMTERRSRLHLLARSPDRKAENVASAIIGRLGALMAVVHTLTADNGKEFAGHRVIESALKADFYFADAYAAWQRGSNENANGLTRRYLPRKLDFATVTDERLRWIEDRLNTRPRKTLAFRTPLAIFTRETRTVANRS